MFWLLLIILVVVAIIVKIKRNVRVFTIRQHPFDRGQDNPFSQQKSQPPFGSKSSVAGEIEHMVSCEYCEVYFPASEAVTRQGKTFCCHEHSEAYFSGSQLR